MLKFKNQLELSPRLKSAVGRSYSKNRLLKISSFVFLLVAAGLTVNSLWIVFGKTSIPTTDTSAPQVLGAVDTQPQSENQEIKFEEYKVKKGDTLFNISQEFNIHWMTIATLNNLKSPFSLKPGQTIKIPR
ncbi:MAG: LysM peptidoglycan-binding domain-containing protein [Patescibacteria group bacterium]|nr:LysM peptidoglycan-binding domain-containing protein [Patescibacteria group bacterium]